MISIKLEESYELRVILSQIDYVKKKLYRKDKSIIMQFCGIKSLSTMIDKLNHPEKLTIKETKGIIKYYRIYT